MFCSFFKCFRNRWSVSNISQRLGEKVCCTTDDHRHHLGFTGQANHGDVTNKCQKLNQHLLVVSLIHRCKIRMASTLKTLVSKKKLRYVEDGYNLDLSYISDRIIAMGYPAENLEALYRNSLDEVKKFLDDKHENHYKIYNLCSEKIYDPRKFHGRVEHYPFDDHHPPTFALIGPFCENVQSWLAEDPLNVAAVHCKAGKGRTGVMICCYFLHCGLMDDAQGVLNFYGSKRTADKKGVTIPSQRRYIHYYDRLLNRGLVYKSVKLYLRCIVLDPVPYFTNIVNDCFLTFVVYTPNRSIPYESRCYIMKRTDRQVRLEVEPPLLVSDDVKIEFFTRPRLDYVGLHPKLWRKGNKEFHFWLNTFFVDAEMNGGLAHDILAREHTVLNNCESWLAPTTARVAPDDQTHHLRNFFLNHSHSDAQDKNHREIEDEEDEDEMEEDIEVEMFQPKFLNVNRRLSQHANCEMVSASQDSSLDHLVPPRMHQTVVGMSNMMGGGCSAASLAELMKQNTFLTEEEETVQEDEKLQPVETVRNKISRSGRISHVTLTSSISNASSSSSSSSSLLAAATQSSLQCNNSFVDSSVQATTTSFIKKRTRHASVPQTTSSPGAMSHLISSNSGERKVGHNSAPANGTSNSAPSVRPVAIDGTNIALRLNKSQIDKAAKDKQCKVYSENFNVTLFLVKPTNQGDDLIDHSLQQPSVAPNENLHYFTVTPVMSSASTTSCNVPPTEDWRTIKSLKSAKKAEQSHKNRIAQMQLPKKLLSSTEDEAAAAANHFGEGFVPPVSPRAVTFADGFECNNVKKEKCDGEENHNNVIREKNGFADPKKTTEDLEEDRNNPNNEKKQPSQSTWI